DSRSLLHTRLDGLGRRHQVRSHRLGTAAQEDAILLEESDHWATLELSRSRDGSAVMIRSASPRGSEGRVADIGEPVGGPRAGTVMIRSAAPRGSEVWIADLEDPEAAPRSVTGRLTGARTALVEHAGARLLVLHESGEHGRTVLGEAELGTTGGLPEAPVLLSAADGEHFESVEAFADVVALQVRSGGVPRLRLIPRRADGSLDTGAMVSVGRGGELDAVRLEPVPSWTARRIRYRLDSFLTAGTLLEHDLDTGRSV